MQLAQGRDHLAIPGPSVIPDSVLRAMHRAAPNIYAGELVELTASLLAELKIIAGCSGDLAIYHGNGHAVWEACLCNCFSRGDRILVLVTGRFGEAWATMARELGIEVDVLESEPAQPIDPQRLTEALRCDSHHRIKAVLSVQTDTATSTSNDIPALREALDKAAHPALLAIDAIASFGCEPFYMDEWGVDLLLAASQKGLMTPPGLGLLYVGRRVWPLHAKAGLNTPYWNMKPRVEPAMFPDHFCGTPPTHHLFAMRAAVDLLMEEGMQAVWQRHRVFARCVWQTVDAWAEQGELHCHVPDASHRSTAVTTICTAKGDAARLTRWCESELGVVLGVGLGASASAGISDSLFRIGHMGHLNPPMLLGTLACIDTGLKALNIAHGQGAMAAATQSISDSISQADRIG